ncbi:MAG: hypothetical protein RLZZ597_2366 [Cyanobacteriota bacterium]|jgi:ribosome-associated toxin RatA of RatAB toxin-antitoxin module
MTIHSRDLFLSEGAASEAGNRWVSEDALALENDWSDTEDLVEEAEGDEITDRVEGGIAIHTEKLRGRRRIHAITDLPFTADQLWQILTDYDNLASFIPNLSRSRRLPHPDGGIRLEQVGSQAFLNVKFCARVVLDAVEVFPQEIRFTMVEGDFRQFEGKWTLDTIAGPSPRTRLSYDLLICPPLAMPAGLIERHIRHDLTRNLQAIGERAMDLFGAS